MHVSREALLGQLPPFADEWVTLTPDQDVHDIIVAMVDSYPEFAPYYDRIGNFFVGKDISETCDNLYQFCKDNIQYREETEDWQTVSLPAGILTRGHGDCKAYAAFIGGCLGAIARETGVPIDWEYCFASYKLFQRTPYHVFVVVHTADGDIWVDPTPGAEDKQPVWVVCKKPAGAIGGMQQVVDEYGQLGYQRIGATSIPKTGDAEVDSILQVVTPVIATLQQTFPRGTLFGDWLSDFANPGQALKDIGHLLFGYKYTFGDYALGEIFLNRVMNQQTSNRKDVPDGVVPIAWDYFTQLLGIPINVNTDIDYLGGNDSLEGYLQGRPEQRGYVTQAQVTRAHQLIQMFGNILSKYGQWPPSSFGLLPYAGPIPTAHGPGGLYTGVLPNGQQVVNGYPVSAATKGGNVIMPGEETGTGISTTTIILIGAAALLLWWYTSDN